MTMGESRNRGPIFDPGLCRCCGSIKKCRVLNVEYEFAGQKEVYSDLFVDCFGLMLSHLDGEPKERLICATCVLRLREASSFRKQVLQCEEMLLKSRIEVHGQDEEMDKDFRVKIMVKDEQQDDCTSDVNSCDHNGYEDPDDVPLSQSLQVTKRKARKKEKVEKKEGLEISETKMLKEIKRTRRKLQDMTKTENAQCFVVPPLALRPETLHTIGTLANKLKAERNTATIVQYSYVCPFLTPYSSDYYCVYCREKFSDPDKFREHNLTHDPKKYRDLLFKKKYPQIDVYRIDCRLCTETINDLETLKAHLKKSHGKCVYSNVPDGFLKFKLTKKNLTCLECDASFDFFLSLKKHMAEHFGSCICDVCGAHFYEDSMLVVHQKTHQKIAESFPCSECGKSFKSKYSRHLHVSKIHAREPVYQCTKCDQAFFTKTLRVKHMKESHGEVNKFVCGKCERVYDNRRSLTEHYRKCHAKFFKHQCNICDKRFYMPCQLKDHMSIHTGERNFRCDQCGKTYPRLRALKLHVQSHTNEKKYTCAACSASFTQKSSLKNHMQKQHQSLDVNEKFPVY